MHTAHQTVGKDSAPNTASKAAPAGQEATQENSSLQQRTRRPALRTRRTCGRGCGRACSCACGCSFPCSSPCCGCACASSCASAHPGRAPARASVTAPWSGSARQHWRPSTQTPSAAQHKLRTYPETSPASFLLYSRRRPLAIGLSRTAPDCADIEDGCVGVSKPFATHCRPCHCAF